MNKLILASLIATIVLAELSSARFLLGGGGPGGGGFGGGFGSGPGGGSSGSSGGGGGFSGPFGGGSSDSSSPSGPLGGVLAPPSQTNPASNETAQAPPSSNVPLPGKILHSVVKGAFNFLSGGDEETETNSTTTA